MKKIIAMFICMTVLVISAAVASAQMYPGEKDQKVYFDINVFCNSTTTYTRARDCERKINSVAAIVAHSPSCQILSPFASPTKALTRSHVLSIAFA